MKDELGLGYCGLVCGLCSENESCVGCKKGGCPEKDFCNTSYGLEHFVNLLDNMGKKN